MKKPNSPWWEENSRLTKRRIQYAHYGVFLTLPDEHGRSVIIEALTSGHRATFGTGHVLYISTRLPALEAIAVIKSITLRFALTIAQRPAMVYQAIYAVDGTITCRPKRKSAQAEAFALDEAG